MASTIEFDLPTEEFALEEPLRTVPEARIEIERVVARLGCSIRSHWRFSRSRLIGERGDRSRRTDVLHDISVSISIRAVELYPLT